MKQLPKVSTLMRLLLLCKRSYQGFTLIELLVVISIIAILAIVGATVYSSVQTNVRISAAKATLHNLQQSMIRYKINNGQLPPTGDNCPACTPDNTARATDLRNNLLAVLASSSNGGPYIEDKEPFVLDPWGIALWYDDNDEGFSAGPGPCQSGVYSGNSPLYSSGPDKTNGTGDDIHFDIRCP